MKMKKVIMKLNKLIMMLLAAMMLITGGKCELKAEANVEDINPEGLTFDKPEDMYTYFVNETSFINNNQDYDDYMKIMIKDGVKKEFLVYNSYLTQADIDNMSDYEAFIYLFLYQDYQIAFHDMTPESVDDIEAHLIFDKGVLETYPDGDKVYDAMLKVMTYQWEYEEYTGEVLNIYDPTKSYCINIYSEDITLPESEATETTESTEATESSTTEAASADNDSKKIDETETPKNTLKKDFVATVIKYSFTLVILLITGIALLIVYIKKKRGNYK